MRAQSQVLFRRQTADDVSMPVHRHPAVVPPALIEVHVELIEQLFNSIDPSPFHARDLDPQADDYIVACARELPRDESIALGELSQGWLPRGSPGEILREGLLIGGWVAMWRPMEVFLYDWWPIAADISLFERLARMPVRVLHRRHRATQAPHEAAPISPPAP